MIHRHRIYKTVITGPNGIKFEFDNPELIPEEENDEYNLSDDSDDENGEAIWQAKHDILFELFDITFERTEKVVELETSEGVKLDIILTIP